MLAVGADYRKMMHAVEVSVLSTKREGLLVEELMRVAEDYGLEIGGADKCEVEGGGHMPVI